MPSGNWRGKREGSRLGQITRCFGSERQQQIQRQQETPITVIVGNPPYRAGQKSADDDNPNVSYEFLEMSVSAIHTLHVLMHSIRESMGTI